MKRFGSFEDITKELNKYIFIRSKNKPYTLDNMVHLMSYLGNPQNKYQVVHVAGTSGKTSTCYYLQNLLLSSGFKTGMTVSPHVTSINERVQINGVPLDPLLYFSEMAIFLDLLEENNLSPNYFELLIAFSFWEFERQKVDIAIVEVGIGGLLDSTNVISRQDKVCVITDIGFDHTEILGDTIAKIAGQKAGIIQTDNYAITNNQSDEVLRIFKAVCKEKNTKLEIATTLDNIYDLAPFKIRNLQLAFSVTNLILKQTGIKVLTGKQVRDAARVIVPGRMEIHKLIDKTIILDGSHNPQKLHALTVGISNQFKNSDPILVVSIGNNKINQIEDILNQLVKISKKIILTEFMMDPSIRRIAIEKGRLKSLCKLAGFDYVKVESNPLNAFKLSRSSECDLIVVTGSFYLLNEIRPYVISEMTA